MCRMLYLITNRKLANKDFFQVIEEGVMSGIDAVILREKDLDYDELKPIAQKIKSIIDKYNINNKKNIKLMINSNHGVAVDIKAHGLHMTYNDFINKNVEFRGEIGVSVHSIEEAVECEKRGADYIIISHIFPTECKKNLNPKGIEFIKDVRKKVQIPIIALGGINKDNIKTIMKAEADGAAVMSGIMASDNPSKTVIELKENMR